MKVSLLFWKKVVSKNVTLIAFFFSSLFCLAETSFPLLGQPQASSFRALSLSRRPPKTGQTSRNGLLPPAPRPLDPQGHVDRMGALVLVLTPQECLVTGSPALPDFEPLC